MWPIHDETLPEPLTGLRYSPAPRTCGGPLSQFRPPFLSFEGVQSAARLGIAVFLS